MRKDEIFALKSIAARYSGEWKPGENPPDGYVTFLEHTVAVEVSTLTQHIKVEKGTRPRRSDDSAAITLADELNEELRSAIPTTKRVMLHLSSPIADYRKTKTKLLAEILSFVSGNPSGRVERMTTIRGNKIGMICLDVLEGDEQKKIVAIIGNRFSSPRILKNTIQILEDRISTKASKCAGLSSSGPIWLALINDYFLAAADTYRHALQFISVDHPFEKILLVSGSGAVDVLVDNLKEPA